MNRDDFEAFAQRGSLLSLTSEKIYLSWGSQSNSDYKWLKMSFSDSSFETLSYEKNKIFSLQELLGYLDKLELDKKSCRSWVSPKFENFQTYFSTIQEAIAKKELQKAVPVMAWSSKSAFKTSEILLSLKSFLKTYAIQKNGWIYGSWDGQSGFMGLTPEILFKKQNHFDSNSLETFALAGTDVHTGKLLYSSKDLKEHQFVVEDVCCSLASFGVPQVEFTKEIAFGGLYHLKTKIKLKTNKFFSEKQIIERLHPTAALGCLPKTQKKCLQNIRPSSASYFGSPFTLCLPSGLSLSVVTLRGLQWNSEGVFVHCGCGVVEESILQKEWQELGAKVAQIKEFLHSSGVACELV